MEKRNHKLHFFVSCDKFGWTKSFSVSRNSFEMLFLASVIFAVAGALSLVLSYAFYEEVQTVRTEKSFEVGRLLSSAEITSKRLSVIENKLVSMDDVLSKKGLDQKLYAGGTGIGTGDTYLDYLQGLHEDVDDTSHMLKIVPFGRPYSGEVSSNFGYRNSPFSRNKKEFHGGMDFRGTTGDSIIATADGVVEKARWIGGYGKSVILSHENGYKTLYAHLSKINVKKGQKVGFGEVIGEIGSTGRSTGPHLHYEIIKNGKRLDPKKYVSHR